MKRKWVTVGIILLFIGTCLIPAIAQDTEKPAPTSRGEWLYVGGSGPGNYTKIQDAVNASSDGDTVFVYSGLYPEWVRIGASIRLIGEDKNTTIIEGGWGYGVKIEGDGVLVTGFTVQNCGGYYSGGITLTSDNNSILGNILINNIIGGIYVYGDNNTIANNSIIGNNNRGISVNDGYYNTMSGNIIEANNHGIVFVEIRGEEKQIFNNTITGNVIKNNTDGILLEKGNATIISRNWITGNGCGIAIWCLTPLLSSYNVVTQNVLSNNTYGLDLWDSTSNLIYHNTFIKNTHQASDESYAYPCVNQWDNGYPSGGNYWSDYNGTDECSGPNQDIPGNDSVGDTPYGISGSSKSFDRYPSMKAFVHLPPFLPVFSGPSWGIVNVEYTFSVPCMDPNRDKVYCRWDWGEGTVTDWIGPFFSGETAYETHTWSTNGSYWIRVQLKDVNGEQSDWSTPCLFTVHGVRKAFLLGKYSPWEQQNGTLTIEAVNLRVLRFKPIHMIHYTGEEQITFLNNTMWGWVFPRVIIALVDEIT